MRTWLLTTFALASAGCAAEAPVAPAPDLPVEDRCANANASRDGYLHVTRHGSWVSSDPGTNGEGVRVRMVDADLPQEVLTYLRDPRIHLNNTLHAQFRGDVSCNDDGIPVFNVREVDDVRVTPVLDASDV